MELTGFLNALVGSVRSTKMSETQITPRLQPIFDYLQKLHTWVEETPAVEQPMRFGNKAFRTWLEKVMANIQEDCKAFSNMPGFEKSIPEISVYLQESFGSHERIDYGTGHELNFVAFMFCLFKMGVLIEEDLQAAVNCVFQKYMLLMRKIQLDYVLEPAGSHGVWGLDDYQILAFMFGASQLRNSPQYMPDSIHEERAMRDIDNYMYFGCIKFIKDVKKGCPFYESSPMLNDISNVPSWDKVTTGLQKMFQAEVIGKHPVIKHLKHGSLIVFNP